jgi:hypothetical protein
MCHRFCDVKIETDHMLPKSQNGTDSIKIPYWYVLIVMQKFTYTITSILEGGNTTQRN